MSRLVQVDREFPTWAAAEAYFDSIWRTAWPYVWCIECPETSGWRVTALVEVGPARVQPDSQGARLRGNRQTLDI